MAQRKPIISARRNEKLEAMLQKLWSIRPELEGKQAGTIMAGVSALLREAERSDALVGQRASAPAVAAPSKPETMVKNEDEDNPISPAAAAMDHPKKDISTDVEWD